ncbi:MAG: hypothetical protein ABSB29_08160 [Nitrososphaerales archaeon]|jgi:hypothetical protein
MNHIAGRLLAIGMAAQLKSDPLKPLFAIALPGYTYGYLLMSAFGFLMFVAGLLPGSAMYASTEITSLSVAVFLFVSFVGVNVTHKVKKASFFDTFFQVRTEGIDRIINYDEIKNVAKVSRFDSLFLPQIEIRGEKRVYRLYTNTKNRKLDIDLYSWLLEKTKPGAVKSR